MTVVVKLFILGLPGCGKSAIARFVSAHVRDYQWKVYRLNDYTILDKLFRLDVEGKRFKPAESGGFDVLDLKVFDEALPPLEQEACKYINSLEPNEKRFIIIEFSRNNYKNAFRQFNEPFLKDAYFLHLHADIQLCRQRICDRVAKPQFVEDDFNVSDYIFENYYHGDDGADLIPILAECGVDRTHVRTMKNHDSYEKSCLAVEPYIKLILDSVTQEKSGKRENSPEELALGEFAGNENQEPLIEKKQTIVEKKYAEIGS